MTSEPRPERNHTVLLEYKPSAVLICCVTCCEAVQVVLPACRERIEDVRRMFQHAHPGPFSEVRSVAE